MIQPEHQEHERTYQMGNGAPQDRSFQRLPDEASHVSRINDAGLDPKHLGSSAIIERNHETSVESYGLNHILVRNDYEVTCNNRVDV